MNFALGRPYLWHGVTWASGAPALLLADTSTATMDAADVMGLRIGVKAAGGGRFCTGRYGFAGTFRVTPLPCPQQAQAGPGGQCATCRERDDFRFAHHAHKGGHAPAALTACSASPTCSTSPPSPTPPAKSEPQRPRGASRGWTSKGRCTPPISCRRATGGPPASSKTHSAMTLPRPGHPRTGETRRPHRPRSPPGPRRARGRRRPCTRCPDRPWPQPGTRRMGTARLRGRSALPAPGRTAGLPARPPRRRARIPHYGEFSIN